MTDGILLTELTATGPAPVRHADHRRGHERSLNIDFILVTSAAAARRRTEGHHHLRDHRPGAVRAASPAPSSRCPADVPVEVRTAAGETGEALSLMTGRPGAGDQRRGRRAVPRDRRHLVFSAASARSGHATCWRRDASRSCRCTRAVRRRAAQGVPAPVSLELHPPVVLATNVPRLITVPGSSTSSIRYRAFPGTATDQGAAAADRAISQARPTSARAAAGAPQTDLHPAVLEEDFESRPEFTDPRSCAPTWPR